MKEISIESPSSLLFPTISLEELTDRLLAPKRNLKRLPVPEITGRPELVTNPQAVEQTMIYLSALLPENQVQPALYLLLSCQPAMFTYFGSPTGPDDQNILYVKTAILQAVNQTRKKYLSGKEKRSYVKQTSLPENPLLLEMAGSLVNVRRESEARKNLQPETTPQNRLNFFINQASNGRPLTASQREFILLTKLAGVFDPDLTDLQQFLWRQQQFPGRPAKLDVCASFGAGSLGQLMPQPTLITTQAYGEKGRYQGDKQPTRFLRFLKNALDETAMLEQYGIKTQIITAEWEMPLRLDLYRFLGRLSEPELMLFGITTSDIKTILTEYRRAYSGMSLIDIANNYYTDVSRIFPKETDSGKIISSLTQLRSVISQPLENFIQGLAGYVIFDWLLPEIKKAGGIDTYLDQAGTPFTDYFFTSWCDYHGLGFRYNPQQQEALKRSLRLDFAFYRPQYLFEKWLAEQTGFIAVFANEKDEKDFYQPLPGFRYNSSLPLLPVPDRKLLEEI